MRNKNQYSLQYPSAFLMLALLAISFSCRDGDVNWERVDPELRLELERTRPAPDAQYEGILHIKTELTDDEKAELANAGILIRTETSAIVTAQYPIKSLPFLSTRPYIIFISKPAEHTPSPAAP